MSKSKGEFLTVDTLISKGYNPLVFRYMCLNSHYRKTLVFDYKNLDNAKEAYNKLLSRVNSLRETGALEDISFYQNKFKEALGNDLNTSSALTVLYDALKSNLSEKSKLTLVKEFDSVLSLDLLKKEVVSPELKQYIEEKIADRKAAKDNKDYVTADAIREELESKNIYIKDTREGTTFEIRK